MFQTLSYITCIQPSSTEAKTDKILPSPHRLHSGFTNSLNSVLFFPFVNGKFGLGVLEVEENNRMGNIRDLFKKTGEIKETISYKNWHNKGQKWYGPNRNRRGGKNTQKNYTKKVLMTQTTTMVWSLT